jgi:hypothetical protein
MKMEYVVLRYRNRRKGLRWAAGHLLGFQFGRAMVEVPGRILLLDPNDLPERMGKKAAFALAKRWNKFAVFR